MNRFMRPDQVDQLMRSCDMDYVVGFCRWHRKVVTAYILHLEAIARGAGCDVMPDPGSAAPAPAHPATAGGGR